jgi:hypothetical protein
MPEQFRYRLRGQSRREQDCGGAVSEVMKPHFWKTGGLEDPLEPPEGGSFVDGRAYRRGENEIPGVPFRGFGLGGAFRVL